MLEGTHRDTDQLTHQQYVLRVEWSLPRRNVGLWTPQGDKGSLVIFISTVRAAVEQKVTKRTITMLTQERNGINVRGVAKDLAKKIMPTNTIWCTLEKNHSNVRGVAKDLSGKVMPTDTVWCTLVKNHSNVRGVAKDLSGKRMLRNTFWCTLEKNHSNVRGVAKDLARKVMPTDTVWFTLEKNHSNVKYVTKDLHINVIWGRTGKRVGRDLPRELMWTGISWCTVERNHFIVRSVAKDLHGNAVWWVTLGCTDAESNIREVMVKGKWSRVWCSQASCCLAVLFTHVISATDLSQVTLSWRSMAMCIAQKSHIHVACAMKDSHRTRSTNSTSLSTGRRAVMSAGFAWSCFQMRTLWLSMCAVMWFEAWSVFRPFSCGTWQEIRKQALTKYCLVHTGKKPFKCRTCDRQFSRKGNLKAYRLLLAGERWLTYWRFTQNSYSTLRIRLFTSAGFCQGLFLEEDFMVAHLEAHTCSTDSVDKVIFINSILLVMQLVQIQ